MVKDLVFYITKKDIIKDKRLELQNAIVYQTNSKNEISGIRKKIAYFQLNHYLRQEGRLDRIIAKEKSKRK